jgi:serine/threonine protein kinase
MNINTVLKTLNQNDAYQIKFNFPNKYYVCLETGNNIFHLLAMVETLFDRYSYLIDELINDNGVDINKLNLKNRNCIHEALKYSNYKFIKYVMTLNKFNLVQLDINNFTPFTWACFRGNIDIIILILENGGEYKSGDLSYISCDKLRSSVSKILINREKIKYNIHIGDGNMPDDYDFRIYKEDDFILESDIIASGTYGYVRVAVDIKTGNKCILKTFKSNINYTFSTSEIRDIMILKHLKPNKHVVNIYGILIDKYNNIYIVMEKLIGIVDNLLYDIYKVKDDNKRIEMFRNLLYHCIKCVDGNSKAGVIHCDVKNDNLMINEKGEVKFIDYGFSYYLGISPFVNNINKKIHNGEYLAKDGVSENNQDISYFDENGNVILTIKKDYTGLNLDISSLAIMFILNITKYKDLCFTHKNKMYVNNKKFWKLTDEHHSSILYFFGSEMTNILYLMLEVDSNIRPTAKELLALPFFGGTSLTIPKDIKIKNVKFSTNKNNNLFNYYNTITKENYIRSGFVYFDEILDHWKDENISILNVDIPELKSIFSLLRETTINYNISTDALFNTIYYINSCVNRDLTDEITPLRINDFIDNKDISLYILSQYSNLYDDSEFEKDILIIEMSKANNIILNNENLEIYKNKVQDLANKIRSDTYFYKMIPTMFYVGYIKFILQYIIESSNKINNICTNLTMNIYNEITSKSNFQNDITIGEFIINIYKNTENNIKIYF